MRLAANPLSHKVIRSALQRNRLACPDDYGPGFTSLGWKFSNGVQTREKALKFHLIGKGDLNGRTRIPKQLAMNLPGAAGQHSILTDVVDISDEPQLFDVRGGDLLQAFDGDRGICGIAFTKKGIGYGMTNAHVVRRMESDGESGPIDWLDAMLGWQADIGLPIMASEISYKQTNFEDVAVIRFANVEVAHLLVSNAGIPLQKLDVIRPFNGEYWFFAGDSINKCRNPEPVDRPAPVSVDGRIANYANFWSLKLSSGSIAPGMSGSLLCRTTDGVNYACGLIFGGVKDRFVWAFSFAPLFNRIWPLLP